MKDDKEFLSNIYDKAENYKKNPPDWFIQEECFIQNNIKNSVKTKKISSLVASFCAVLLIGFGIILLPNNSINDTNSSNSTRFISQYSVDNSFLEADIVAIVSYDVKNKTPIVNTILKNNDSQNDLWEKSLQAVEIDKNKQSIIFFSKENGAFNVKKLSELLSDESGEKYYIGQDNQKIYVSSLSRNNENKN